MYDDFTPHYMGLIEDKIPKTINFNLSLMAIKMQQQTKRFQQCTSEETTAKTYPLRGCLSFSNRRTIAINQTL